jgi:hypothetical protein
MFVAYIQYVLYNHGFGNDCALGHKLISNYNNPAKYVHISSTEGAEKLPEISWHPAAEIVSGMSTI